MDVITQPCRFNQPTAKLWPWWVITSYLIYSVSLLTHAPRPCRISDVNECQEDPLKCGLERSCVNLPGGHTCYCPRGYELLDGLCVGKRIIGTHDPVFPGRCGFDFKCVIFKSNGLYWLLLFTADLSTLACSCRTTSLYLNQCWLWSLTPCGIIKPQSVNIVCDTLITRSHFSKIFVTDALFIVRDGEIYAYYVP